jgi:hypothetical protein
MKSIASIGFDGIYALYHRNNQPVKIGDLVTDFGDNIHIVRAATAPRHKGSTGEILTNQGFFSPYGLKCKFVNIHPDNCVSPIQASD